MGRRVVMAWRRVAMMPVVIHHVQRIQWIERIKDIAHYVVWQRRRTLPRISTRYTTCDTAAFFFAILSHNLIKCFLLFLVEGPHII